MIDGGAYTFLATLAPAPGYGSVDEKTGAA